MYTTTVILVLIYTINLQLYLYSNSEVKRVFSPAPIVSYRSASKIILYVVLLKIIYIVFS